MFSLTPDAFLLCPTPDSWLALAKENLPILLIDHANCEKKAASTAMSLIYKYVDKPELLKKLSRLAREELRHFEQVLEIMESRKVEYVAVSSSRYAAGLRKDVRTFEPARLVDMLIVGALVEARSCERFGKLIAIFQKTEPELSKFYESLLKSEARHFTDYLGLASKYAKGPIDDRLAHFLEKDRELVESEDVEFRFHSGAHHGTDSLQV